MRMLLKNCIREKLLCIQIDLFIESALWNIDELVKRYYSDTKSKYQ